MKAKSLKEYKNGMNNGDLHCAAYATASVTTSPDSTLPAYSISVGGLSLTNCTSAGIVSSREYDALGRQVAMSLSSHESPRSGVNVSGLRPSLITKHSLRSALGILLSPSPGEGCFQRSATGAAREKRLPFAEIRGRKNSRSTWLNSQLNSADARCKITS